MLFPSLTFSNSLLSDLPFRGRGSIPDTYTQFRKDVESKSRVRPLIQTPASLPSLPEGLEVGEIPSLQSLVEASDYQADPRSAFPFTGGETSGLERLHYYLWTSDCVAKYKETRNGLVGQDYSTKFSPWLAAGCLSPRQIYWEIKKYEEKRVGNQSTYWVIFELLWRDYFKMVCFKYGDSVFYETGIQNKKLPWSQVRKSVIPVSLLSFTEGQDQVRRLAEWHDRCPLC